MDAYVVTHGDHSSYTVDCVFERLEDAVQYLRVTTGGVIAERDGRWGDSYSNGWRVEVFQFWPAGDVPNAKTA